MSIYDRMYQNVHTRQEQARGFVNMRYESMRKGDWKGAHSALNNFINIGGLPLDYLQGVRTEALNHGDHKLADGALYMINRDAANQPGNPGGFPGGGFGPGGYGPSGFGPGGFV